MSLRGDRPRHVGHARARHNRNAHSHHEVDCIAHLAAAVHPRTVVPGRQRCLGTGVSALLERRCPTQRAEVSRGTSPVIADGVSGDHQGGTAERHDDAQNPGHQNRCASQL